MAAAMPEPRRGQVWLADLDKRRPVIVLTRDPLGRYLNSVLVAPVTSTVRGVSTEVAVGPADDVRVPSVANLDNLQLVDRRLLVRHVGKVQSQTLHDLCAAASIALGCR